MFILNFYIINIVFSHPHQSKSNTTTEYNAQHRQNRSNSEYDHNVLSTSVFKRKQKNTLEYFNGKTTKVKLQKSRIFIKKKENKKNVTKAQLSKIPQESIKKRHTVTKKVNSCLKQKLTVGIDNSKPTKKAVKINQSKILIKDVSGNVTSDNVITLGLHKSEKKITKAKKDKKSDFSKLYLRIKKNKIKKKISSC